MTQSAEEHPSAAGGAEDDAKETFIPRDLRPDMAQQYETAPVDVEEVVGNAVTREETGKEASEPGPDPTTGKEASEPEPTGKEASETEKADDTGKEMSEPGPDPTTGKEASEPEPTGKEASETEEAEMARTDDVESAEDFRRPMM